MKVKTYENKVAVQCWHLVYIVIYFQKFFIYNEDTQLRNNLWHHNELSIFIKQQRETER